jgi:hypothetical protein
MSFFSFAWVVDAYAADADKLIGFFTNKEIYPETDDCGGYDLWLYEKAESVKGFLSVYEGNCDSVKQELQVVRFDRGSGALSFQVPGFSDDYFLSFDGYLKTETLTGTMLVRNRKMDDPVEDRTDDDDVSHKDQITLSKVKLPGSAIGR